jgi:hypothetical protein
VGFTAEIVVPGAATPRAHDPIISVMARVVFGLIIVSCTCA